MHICHFILVEQSVFLIIRNPEQEMLRKNNKSELRVQ